MVWVGIGEVAQMVEQVLRIAREAGLLPTEDAAARAACHLVCLACMSVVEFACDVPRPSPERPENPAFATGLRPAFLGLLSQKERIRRGTAALHSPMPRDNGHKRVLAEIDEKALPAPAGPATRLSGNRRKAVPRADRFPSGGLPPQGSVGRSAVVTECAWTGLHPGVRGEWARAFPPPLAQAKHLPAPGPC